jgi:hypothetical protein
MWYRHGLRLGMWGIYDITMLVSKPGRAQAICCFSPPPPHTFSSTFPFHLHSNIAGGGHMFKSPRAGAVSMSAGAQRSDPQSSLGKRSRQDDQSQGLATSSPGSDRLFRCGSCDKSYSRIDHLSRHVRLHTKVCKHRSRDGLFQNPRPAN